MRVLIAYDGSGYSRASLSDLQRAGLPPSANVVVLSISEVWLSPTVEQKDIPSVADTDIAEYFQKFYDQADRNLAEANALAKESKAELLRYFPRWTIETEAFAGSPASLLLSKAAEFKPNLIVMGSQGLSSDNKTGLGSIAQKVLAGASCSVRVARGIGVVTAEERVSLMRNVRPFLGGSQLTSDRRVNKYTKNYRCDCVIGHLTES